MRCADISLIPDSHRAFAAHVVTSTKAHLPLRFQFVLYKQVVIHISWALAFTLLLCPPQRLIFRVAFHLFVSLKYKSLCCPPQSADYSTYPTYLSMSLSASLFPALFAPRCTTLPSLPLIIFPTLHLLRSVGH